MCRVGIHQKSRVRSPELCRAEKASSWRQTQVVLVGQEELACTELFQYSLIGHQKSSKPEGWGTGTDFCSAQS